MKKANVTALPKPGAAKKEYFELGKNLFFDKVLSGERNVSCSSCHSPEHGLSSGMAYGIGGGGIGSGPLRKASAFTQYTLRNPPQLFNLSGQPTHFWDGQVSYYDLDSDQKILTTPEPGLNGEYPYLTEVIEALRLASKTNSNDNFMSLAAQILFPIANTYEMKGSKYAQETNEDYWQRIVNQVLAVDGYKALFKRAFPQAKGQYNIGHIGVAVAEFIRQAFSATETPFDKYLQGRVTALSIEEKRGALLFYSEKAKCSQCHTGPHLSDFDFKSVGVPQGGPGVSADGDDYGRSDYTNSTLDVFKFKTPVLRNVVLSGPFMHNGVFKTMKEVVVHYNDVGYSIDHFDFEKLSQVEQKNYKENSKRNNARYNSVEFEFRMPLHLTEAEIGDLVKFLEISLTDPNTEKSLKSYKGIKVPSGLPID